MARLINLDDAVDAMKKSICGDTYEVDKAIEAIENITPVEAIPIEWIERYIKCEDMLVGYAKNYILWMLSDWRKEQEEKNDKTD